jgi:serine/threonine-protein phosphatase with EF-hand domain
MEKYKEHSNKILKLLEDTFGWLPLATVVNNKIFVAHGGISNITDLDIINKIDRHKVSHKEGYIIFIPLKLPTSPLPWCRQ